MTIAVLWLCGLLTVLGAVPAVVAQAPDTDPRPAPPRTEGDGPFEQLIIRNAILIDGTLAPPVGRWTS